MFLSHSGGAVFKGAAAAAAACTLTRNTTTTIIIYGYAFVTSRYSACPSRRLPLRDGGGGATATPVTTNRPRGHSPGMRFFFAPSRRTAGRPMGSRSRRVQVAHRRLLIVSTTLVRIVQRSSRSLFFRSLFLSSVRRDSRLVFDHGFPVISTRSSGFARKPCAPHTHHNRRLPTAKTDKVRDHRKSFASFRQRRSL